VLQVVLSLNPGGTERLVIELASRLHHEMPMMVCCLDTAGTWARDLEEQGIEVHALGRPPGFRPAVGRGIARLTAAHQADVIHAHHYSPFVYSCLSRFWRRRPQVVFTEHGRLSDGGPSPKRRLANQVLARVPRRVFTVSEDLRRHLVAEGFPPERVDVIYNGIALETPPDRPARARVRAALHVADDVLLIGTIARLDPVKNLETLVRAVARLSPHCAVALVIVGDGPERPRLEELARDLAIASSVIFVGEQASARRWLAGCDVYVNCSTSEGVSLTILEAMAAALPVVATRVGGTPEVLDESCGQLIPARSVDALVAALAAWREPSARCRIGRAARCRVERSFTLDRMIGQYRDVYATVAEVQ